MKITTLLLFLLLMTSELSFAQLKILDKKKYFDCLAHIDIDFDKPKKYFEESNKYLNTELAIITTDDRNKIINIERGFIKNSEANNAKRIWLESKSLKDSVNIRYTFSLSNSKNTYYYFAKCFDDK